MAALVTNLSSWHICHDLFSVNDSIELNLLSFVYHDLNYSCLFMEIVVRTEFLSSVCRDLQCSYFVHENCGQN